MRPRSWAPALLMPLGVLAVHQLRYWLAFGPDARHQLAAHGHSYLVGVTPLIVVVASMAVGGLLGRVAEAWRTGRPDLPDGRRLGRVWIATAGGLLAMYAAQELLEGLLAVGHPTGLSGVFGGGGVWAIPASLAVGALLALLLNRARRIIAFAALLSRRRAHPRSGRAAAPRPRGPRRSPRPAPLATAGAGRAPPAECVMSA